MTFPISAIARLAAAAFATGVLLSACGGSGDSGAAKLRVLNATADVTSIDISVDSDSTDEAVLATAVAVDGASDYGNLDSATYTLRLRRNGATTALATTTVAATEGSSYTAIAYGREGALKLLTISDDEDAPSAGTTRIRAFNSSADAGSVDVYLTDASTLLDEATPTMSAIGAGTMGYYTDVARGTYRLRVTGKDDKTDLRLDVSEVLLGDKQVLNLVLQPTPGGVLVHALVVPQGGVPEAHKNTYARVRVVAAASANAAVTAQVGSSSVNVNLRSPSVGSYTLVPAGAQAVTVTVNGSTTLGGTMTLAAGGDYTLLTHGDAAAPVFTLLTDDNRLPTSSAKAKMRLVHAASSVSGGLTLAKDYVAVANDVAYGSASTPAQVDSAAAARIEVTSPLFADPLYADSEIAVTAGGVYTVFMLGGASSPVGVLRRDR